MTYPAGYILMVFVEGEGYLPSQTASYTPSGRAELESLARKSPQSYIATDYKDGIAPKESVTNVE
jgi:hypothetical protein